MFYTTSQYNGMSGSSNSKYARSSVTLAGFPRLAKTLIAIGMIILVTTSSTSAAYLIDYEGDVLPTEAGWISTGDQPGPLTYTESVSNGIFSIDAAALGATAQYDHSFIYGDKDIIVEWRSQTSNCDGFSVLMFSLSGSMRSIALSEWCQSELYAYLDDGVGSLEATPQVSLTEGYHIYCLKNHGSLFSLEVDGQNIATVTLQDPVGLRGRLSLGFIKNDYNIPTQSNWDYIRVYEVPEPFSVISFLCGALLLPWCRTK